MTEIRVGAKLLEDVERGLNELRVGDAIIIKFGNAGGTQKAIVHSRTRAGNVRVLKWSAKAKKWTNPIRLYEGEIIRRAAAWEVAKIMQAGSTPSTSSRTTTMDR